MYIVIQAIKRYMVFKRLETGVRVTSEGSVNDVIDMKASKLTNY